MPVRPIHTPEGFKAILLQHVKLTACKRSIEQDLMENLGHFYIPSDLPHEGDAFWVAKVRSIHGKEWWFRIRVDQTQFRYRVEPITEIPWQYWAGRLSRNHPVHDGDRPAHYEAFRAQGESEWMTTSGSQFCKQCPTSNENTT